MKIVHSLEDDVLMHEPWMGAKISSQAGSITGIDQVDSMAKNGIFNALVMPEIKPV